MAWSAYKNGRGKAPPPGEPLYTLEEIADRLGITHGSLKALMSHHPGLTPWHAADHKKAHHAAAKKNLYRLSDARRWHRGTHS